MDITQMTGEQLCEIQAAEFHKLMSAQNNLQTIAKEIERRKEAEKKVERKKTTEKKDAAV